MGFSYIDKFWLNTSKETILYILLSNIIRSRIKFVFLRTPLYYRNVYLFIYFLYFLPQEKWLILVSSNKAIILYKIFVRMFHVVSHYQLKLVSIIVGMKIYVPFSGANRLSTSRLFMWRQGCIYKNNWYFCPPPFFKNPPTVR